MEKAVVAGIVDTSTGEIVETTDNPSAKTRLHLRVRDELNAQHGAGAYMVFEFNSMGGSGNLSYVRQRMRSSDPTALKSVELLKARYDVASTRRNLARAEDGMRLTEGVRDECLTLFSRDSDAAKRGIVDGAFATELDEAQDAVDTLKQELAHQLKRLRNLEARDQ